MNIPSSEDLAVQINTIQNASCGEANGSVQIEATNGTAPFSYDIGNGTTSEPIFTDLADGTYTISISDANGCFITQEVTIEDAGELVANVGLIQNASCGEANGSFSANVSNGTPPYSYDIGSGAVDSGIFDGLAASTYTLTITDASGCTTTEEVSIFDSSPIVAAIANQEAARCGQDNGSVVLSISSGMMPFTYNIGNGVTNTPSFQNLAEGNYIITITDANGCTTEQAVSIEREVYNLDFAITDVQNTNCGQDDGSFLVDISAGAAPFSFNIGNGVTQDPVFENLASGSYVITISDANGCSVLETILIEDSDSNIEATVSNVTTATCGQSNASFSINATNGLPPYSYDIGFGATQNPDFENVSGGVYFVTITDANACDYIQEISIDETSPVTTSILTQNDASCGDDNGNFTLEVNTGLAPFTFDIGDGASTNPSFENLASGTYIVTITDVNGCTNTEMVNIDQSLDELVATISTTQQASCGEANGSFTVEVSAGSAPFSFDIGNGVSNEPTFTDLASGIYTVSISDANGCSTTQEVTIESGEDLSVEVTNLQSVSCGESNGQFTIQTINGTAPFSFDIGNGNTNDGNFTELASGTYTVSISDANGCFTTQDVTIGGGSLGLTIGIGNLQDATCGEANGSFTVQPNNGVPPYSYNIGDGNTNDPTFANLSAGAYTVSISDAEGCFTRETITIQDEGSSIESFANDFEIATCGRSNGSFTINASNGAAPYSYDIGFGTTNEPVFNNVSGGVYFVTITDANGCQAIEEVTLEETPPITVAMIDIQDAACQAATGAFTIVVNTGTAPFSYDIGNGISSDSIFTDLAAGSYTITISDANGCITTENITLDDSPALTVQVTNQQNANCGQADGAFTLETLGGTVPYSYTIGNGETDNPRFENLGIGSYEVTIHDSNGCFQTETIFIEENNSITAQIGMLRDTRCGEVNGEFMILANGGTPPYSYDIGNGAVNNPSFDNLAAGEYNVTISDNAGCQTVQNLTIESSSALSTSAESFQNDDCGQGIGAFTIFPIGGQAPYTYDIGEGATTINSFEGLSAGTYAVTTTDATGCSFVETVIIEAAGAFELNVTNQINPTCIGEDGSLSIEVTGGTAPFSYNIGNGAVSEPDFSNLSGGTYEVSVSDANGCTNTLSITLTAEGSPISTNVSERVNASCDQANARFTINATGGIAPYTFDAGTGATSDSVFTNIAAGDYNITITDATGCSSTQLVSIFSSNNLPVSVGEIRSATCDQSNGSFSITASSGVAPFSYDYGQEIVDTTGIFTGLAPNIYSVTITDATGCSTVRQVTIGNENSISVMATNMQDASCGNPNGYASVEMLTGRAPYVYNIGTGAQIAPNFPNLAPGDYTVTVMDFTGCFGEVSFNIGDTPRPFVSIFDIQTAECGVGDGAFSVSVAGGVPPFQYNIGDGRQDSPDFDNLRGGTYTVTVTDASDCHVEAGVTIPATGDGPQASFLLDTIGYFVELVNTSINANEYIWTMDDGTTIEEFNILHDYREPGIYNVCLTAINECGEDTFCREVTIVGDGSRYAEIGGIITTEGGATIGDVDISCTSVDDINTGFDGIYAFGNLPTGEDYIVKPSKGGNLLEGVTTFDLGLLQNHVLATDTIDSPYSLIAADINNSGNITALDVLLLQQMLLGIVTELPNNTSWRFVDANFEFPNPMNPWETPFSEQIIANNLTESINDADFIGIKVGDLNGSTNSDFNIGGRSPYTQWIEAYITADRKQIDLHLPAHLFGAQFTLEFDPSVVQIKQLQLGDLPNLSDTNFNFTDLEEGRLAVSWLNDAAEQGGILLHLDVIIEAEAELEDLFQITNSIIRAEAYVRQQEDIELHNLAIVQTIEQTTPFQVYQNEPNPFDVSTHIPFYLPSASHVELTLYDASGRMLRQVSQQFEAGNNSWELFREDLNAGVIYYRVETATVAITKKMVITH